MRPSRKPLIILLVKRAVLFLTVMCALVVFLYGIGNAQEFLDSTQVSLLGAASALGLLVAVGAAYGCALDVYAVFALRSKRYLIGGGVYLIVALFGLAVAVSASGLLVAISGRIA